LTEIESSNLPANFDLRLFRVELKQSQSVVIELKQHGEHQVHQHSMFALWEMVPVAGLLSNARFV
jgi:hypothetical protein